MEFRKMVMITLYAKQKKRHRCTEQTFGLWKKARVGCFEKTASKQVYYLGWNRSPAQMGCMRQVLGPGALGRPRGIGWGGRWEGGSGWGMHVTPWLIHVSVWQNPLQCCEVISCQLIKIKKKIFLNYMTILRTDDILHQWNVKELIGSLKSVLLFIYSVNFTQIPCEEHHKVSLETKSYLNGILRGFLWMEICVSI